MTLAAGNLIHNATDAMDNGGTILIDVVMKKEVVECRFSNDGPSIPKVIREKIFDIGVTTKGSGGWGLFLTLKSLKENKANIRLADKPRPNMTTTFVIRMNKAVH